MRFFRPLFLVLLGGMLAVLAGCASVGPPATRHAGSLVDYLYPKASRAPTLTPTVTELRPPVRVGIAFVPGGNRDATGPTELDKQRLMEKVKASFASYDYIGQIEIIPSTYLRAGGGFDNLEQVARMFNVEVVALLSYDQIRFTDSNVLSMFYWTIVGSYVVHGEQYDVQTLLDAAVFDVKSRKLLFRAPGSSQVKGAASAITYSEKARAAQARGYAEAVERLIPQLQAELAGFKERVKADPQFRVANKEGYKGGGAFGWPAAALALLLGALALAPRRNRSTRHG